MDQVHPTGHGAMQQKERNGTEVTAERTSAHLSPEYIGSNVGQTSLPSVRYSRIDRRNGCTPGRALRPQGEPNPAHACHDEGELDCLMLASIVALGLAMQTTPQYTGDNLYSACKVYVEMTDHEKLTGPPFTGGYCMGLLAGLGLAFGADHRICPSGAKVETMARVYMLYVEQNPKLRDEAGEMGMVKALVANYPCSDK